MKKISAVWVSAILILFAIIKTSAQERPSPVKTTLVQPTHLLVTFLKTTSLVFPYAIKSVDRGSRDLLAQKAPGVENVLEVKAAKQGFEQTNLTVITADGGLFSFVVDYADAPADLSIMVTNSQIIRKPAAIFSKDATTDDIQKTAVAVSGKERTMNGPEDEDYDMTLAVKGIFIHNDVLYFQLYLKNNSAIEYSIQSLRFSIIDSKRVKRTASQEVEMQPLYVGGDVDRIQSNSEQIVTVAIPKFTIPDKKYFLIKLTEANGGRHLSIQVENKHLLRARSI